MITPFALLLARCGLSHREAASALGVRLDTVKSWASGRNGTPPAVLEELRTLYARIVRAAAEMLALIAEQAPDEVDLMLAPDDVTARERGWPAVGAQAAMLGVVVAQCRRPMRIVEATAEQDGLS